MTNDPAEQLRQEHNRNREKRIYFLLAASGASLAFATTQMNENTLGSTVWILILSFVLLAGSFISGMKVLSLEAHMISSSSRYVTTIPKVAAAGESVQDFRDHVDRVTFTPLSKKMGNWMKAELWLLFLGAALLPIWKITLCNDCLKSLHIIQ